MPSSLLEHLLVLFAIIGDLAGDPVFCPSVSLREKHSSRDLNKGYSVVRAFIKTRQGRQALKAELNITNEKGIDGFHTGDYWDKLAMWHPEFSEDDDEFMDILVASDKLQELERMLDAKNVASSTLIDDLHGLVKRSFPKIVLPWESFDGPKEMTWKEYHSVATIDAFLDSMEKKLRGKGKVVVIGKSYEGRDMKVLKINTANADKSVWIDGGTHAREWISPATVTFIINELVSNYEKHKSLVDSFQWYFLPVLNPDGYEYSRQSTDARFWRRNKSLHDPSGRCIGVDLNRNWDFHWMEKGASQDFCAQTYAGPMPESEPEVIAVRDYVLGLARNKESPLIAFYTIHSYGQLWCTPWGWSSDDPPGYNKLIRVAEAGVKAIKGVHGKIYKAGTVASLFKHSFGLASGASDDWAFGKAKIPYVYTLEVRDHEHGKYLFLLPPDEIIPTGEEIFAGINASLLEILKIEGEIRAASGEGSASVRTPATAMASRPRLPFGPFPTMVG